MVDPFMVPNWFFNYSVILELAFAMITFTVGLFAFKINKLSEEKSAKLFGISFIFLSLHYFIQSFINFSIVSTLNKNICNLMKIQDINTLNIIGAYSHMLFFIIGLSTLTYMTLKIKSRTAYILILILPLSSILFSENKLYVFYIISSIFLIFITMHYMKNYMKNKQIKTLFILIAFIFLLFGHFLELIAYLLILLNLILVLKDG